MNKVYRHAIGIQLLLDLPWCAVYIGLILMAIDTLRYVNTQLELNADARAVIYTKGLLTKTSITIQYTSINAVNTTSLGNYGYVTIYTKNDLNGIRFGLVKNPDAVKLAILECVNFYSRA